MNKKIRKAIVAGLGITALAGVHAQSQAAAVTDFGILTPTVQTNSGSVSKYAWDGQNNGSFGWQHNSFWYSFKVASAGNVDIKLTTPVGGINPAFSVWKATNPGTGHQYNQVGVTSYFLPDGQTSFVGYANAGPTGWTNGAGLPIGSGSGGTVTVNAANSTTAGLAELVLNSPAADTYLLAVGGSCHSVNCPNSNSNYTLAVSQTAVPIPAAVWLFGSALAGLGVFGRRRAKPEDT